MKAWTAGMALVIAVLAPFAGYAYDDGDWQYWNTESLKGKLTDSVGASGEFEFRFGDGASEYFYQHSQLMLDLKCPVMDWLTISPAFREVHTLNPATNDNWLAEHRSMLNVAASCKMGDWKLQNRVRLSYRDFTTDKDSNWLARNKLAIHPPWKCPMTGMKPYVSDEIFVEQGKAGIYRNRLAAGVGFRLLERLKGEIYYLWQTTEEADAWKDVHAVGTKLKCEF